MIHDLGGFTLVLRLIYGVWFLVGFDFVIGTGLRGVTWVY